MNAAARLLDAEHVARWREFWNKHERKLQAHGIWADVEDGSAKLRVGLHVVVSFTHTDTPVDIEKRLADLMGGARA